jgi:hypothetical protein
MAKRFMIRCSTSIINRKKQIKTTMSYYPTPVRMASNKRQNAREWMWRKYNPAPCWWKCKLVQPLKNQLTYDPAIALLGIYWKEASIEDWHSCVHNSQDMETTQVSING